MNRYIPCRVYIYATFLLYLFVMNLHGDHEHLSSYVACSDQDLNKNIYKQPPESRLSLLVPLLFFATQSGIK